MKLTYEEIKEKLDPIKEFLFSRPWILNNTRYIVTDVVWGAGKIAGDAIVIYEPHNVSIGFAKTFGEFMAEFS